MPMPDKAWDLKDSEQKMCSDLSNQVLDEADGVKKYKELAETFMKSDNPGIRALAILADKLREDEESHKNALTKVIRLVCPIK